MIRVAILLCLLSAWTYASDTVFAAQETSPPQAATIATQPPGPSVLPPKEIVKPLFGQLLKDVKCSKESFNPSLKEKLELSFNLANPSAVTVAVYDADNGLINTVVARNQMTAGTQKVTWDGKDLDGKAVPDEAYYFNIVAVDEDGNKEIYDPTTFSGGEEHDISNAEINPQNQTINYKMPEMGRVLIRIGIQGGPLVNTLVDWQPRVKGVITEYWNGKDKDNLVDIYNHPRYKMIITFFSLPETSVIAYGNKGLNFRDYKKSFTVPRPLKPKRPTSVQKVSNHYGLPRAEDYSPELNMTLVNAKGTDAEGATILSQKTIVKVELDTQDKLIFQNQQFEIVFFLDYDFYAEDESGYTPFNWVWDLSNVKEGEHLLTVNLSSFKDQIGVISRKVKVVKE